MQKARSHRSEDPLLPLVGTRFQVLFTRLPAFFSPFPHGTGALSVTDEYLALEGGPPRFRQDSSCPAVLRYPGHTPIHDFAYGTLTPYGGAFQRASAIATSRAGQCPTWALQPRNACAPVWANPLSLAATRGISVDFYSWSYLDVSVHSVGLCLPMNSGGDDRCHHRPGFPIRASPDHSLRAAPRSLSQLTTPFLACPCQGIHRAPLFA
jgi:hypothetical protein